MWFRVWGYYLQMIYESYSYTAKNFINLNYAVDWISALSSKDFVCSAVPNNRKLLNLR